MGDILKYKLIAIIIVIGILAATLIGCNGVLEEVGNDKEIENVDYLILEGGQVVLPLTPFATLNPLMTNNVSYHYFSKLIFEGLFEFNEKLVPTPKLAATSIIKNEGKTILVTLREDVYWHDGEKLTADDVLFTINVLNSSTVETAFSNLLTSALGAFSTPDSNKITAKVIDDYNIQIDFSQSFNNIKEVLTFPIIPKHIFNNGGGSKDYLMALNIEDYSPIGTGPFKFESYDRNKSIKLVANESYRDGEPSISIVEGKVLSDDELFLTAFEAGQIAITPTIGVDWDKYKDNSKVNIMEYVSSDYEFLGFNFDNELFLSESGNAIRQSILYSIDRQEIIQKIFLGHATQTDVPINPISWLYSDELTTYGFNIDTSKKLLANAGFIDLDSDGILEDSEGNKLSFRLITNTSNLYRLRTAEMIREDLKKIGIEIILDVDTEYKNDIIKEEIDLEWEELNNKIKEGNYDIALLGWQMSTIPELSFVFHSNQLLSNNFIRYNNPEMDTLLINASIAYNEEDKFLAYKNILEHITEELPYVSLFYRNKALLVDTKIMGELNPTFFNPYNGLEKCFLALETN